jgi:hypothetical protein
MSDIDIGPIPEGWTREVYTTTDGAHAESYSLPGPPWLSLHVTGGDIPHVHVFARTTSGLALQVGRLVERGTIAEAVQEIVSFLAPFCPAMTAWIQEAPCTPS